MIRRFYLFLFLTAQILYLSGCTPPNINNQGLTLSPQETYFGEVISEPIIASSSINTIHWNIIFPEDHRLLIDAKPYIRIFNRPDQDILKISLTATEGSFACNQEIKGEEVWAEIGLFYCKDGKEGLCLMQNVLYTIKIDKALPPADLNLYYQVPLE
ncbi:MAG: hypothetical protein KC684_09925 [Candidatus Omnitrophica bacterium]|nr:hypothetical protein [Candidatus Omnitrophota bacterium]